MNELALGILSQLNSTVLFASQPIDVGFEPVIIRGDYRLSVLFYDAGEISFDLCRYHKRFNPMGLFNKSFIGDDRLKEAIEELKTNDVLKRFSK